MASPTTDRRLGLAGNTAIKAPVDCATTGNVTLAGEQTIDGVLTSQSRVLVWQQTTGTENGIYDTNTGDWTRSVDANGTFDLTKGTLVSVTGGTQSGAYFRLNSANPNTPGSSTITFVQDITNSATGFAASLAANSGASLVGFIQAGSGAVTTTLQAKARRIVSASDYGATGASTVTDTAALNAAIAYVHSVSGGVVKIDSFISQTIDLSSLTTQTDVVLLDERYTPSGWYLYHSESADAQFGLRGRATTNGEGPAFVLWNLASSGNRNASIVHWYGPSTTPVVGSYEHWGYLADSTWYAGREWLSSGSIDSGFRGRSRNGPDGGIIWNPTGDASSYRNNPSTGFSQDVLFVWNAPLQTAYTFSAKPLLELHATVASLPLILELQTDTGHAGAAVANATLRFQTGNRAAGTQATKWSIINDYPSSTQLAVVDASASVNTLVFNTGSATQITGGLKFVAQTAASAPNDTLFKDSADGKLKFKDGGGTVNPLY